MKPYDMGIVRSYHAKGWDGRKKYNSLRRQATNFTTPPTALILALQRLISNFQPRQHGQRTLLSQRRIVPLRLSATWEAYRPLIPCQARLTVSTYWPLPKTLL